MKWYHPKPIVRIRGWQLNMAEGDYPDLFFGCLEFADGTLAVIEAQWVMPDDTVGFDDGFELTGTEGVVRLDLNHNPLIVLRDGHRDLPDLFYSPDIVGAVKGALRDELDYVIDRVVTGTPIEFNRPDEGRRVVEIAQYLVKSAADDHEISVEI